MPPKKQKRAKLLKKDRDLMIESLSKQNEDSLEAMEQLRSGVYLKYKQSRKTFVDCLCEVEPAKAAFTECIQGMISYYHRLLKIYSKGKNFGRFEQAWLTRINDYFVARNECFMVWKGVLENSASVVSVEEQRIILSTLMYIVYDIMTQKVKDHKIESMMDSAEAPTSTVQTKKFIESNVSLYRYGGFALHSLIKKYQQGGKGEPNDTLVTILKYLIIKHDQKSDVPSAVKHLDQGGLVLMNPCMLPYLRALIEKVSEVVNQERFREFGRHNQASLGRH